MQKTIINLAKAFVGESQARNRYTTYAKIAKKEGFEQISENFSLTADQETEHAKWLMRMINELKGENSELDNLEVETEVSTIVGDTKENLKAAIAGETFEFNSMYPYFADIAEEEGLNEIANRLRAIAEAESNHESRFKKFLDNLEKDKVFKKDEEATWQCRKCGYRHTNKEAVKECPSCGHPQAYFEIKK
jgi:rubrerythrin